MTKKFLCALTLFLFVFFSGLGLVAAEEINKDFHQSFDVKEGDSLCLRFGDGNVELIPWEKDAIEVRVRYRADIDVVGIRLGPKDAFDVEFRQTADTVYVTGKESSSSSIGFYNKRVYEYVYEVHSPGYIHLDLEGDDGDVTIENWAAEIECRIDDGDVCLRNIVGGRTAIRGEDGDVKIDKLTGNLTIDLDDGNVTLTACDTAQCRVDGEDGDITVNQSRGSFDITVDDGNVVMERIEARGLNVSAADGDIEVDLLAGEILDAGFKTDDGNVRIELEKGFSVSFNVSADEADYILLDADGIESYKENRQSKSGSINGGNGRLQVRTADGNVTIKEKYRD